MSRAASNFKRFEHPRPSGKKTMLTPKRFLNRLISSEIAEPDEIHGCSEKEIMALEKEAGQPLPKPYRAFLAVAGRGAGPFMADLTIYFPEIKGLTKSTRKDFKGLVELPKNAFVFMQRLGETFFFFELDDRDDPPIYGWSEGSGKIEKVCNHFWDFIENEIRLAEML
jgi:hypothetical protein